jgi:hypothetical protein
MSYHDVLFALNASGKIGNTTVERAVVAQRLFDAETARMLAASSDMPTAVGRDFDLRDVLIRDINEQYAGDFLKYVYYHAGWLYLDLAGHETEYVDALAREHLGASVPLLPAFPEAESPPASLRSPPGAAGPGPGAQGPSDLAVMACYRAHLDCRPLSETAARYFYKRYRSLLWSRLRAGGLLRPSDAAVLRQQSAFFLESWDEDASDALKYVAHLATEAVRALFPARLRARAAELPPAAPHLTAEADARLYHHVTARAADPAAENTLLRLTLLERSTVFRQVPAEPLVALAAVLARVNLAAGETLVWEGEENDDVFLLARGELESRVAGARAGVIPEGAVFGETAFFSRRPRHATVVARVPSQCLVIKNVDLLAFAFSHPSVLLQMGGALARRLEDLDVRAADDAEPATTLRFPGRT